MRDFGDVPEAPRIAEVLNAALAPTTAEGYSRHFARFAEWCEEQPDRPCPLPALTKTVVRWLAADVCAGNRVQAESLQPYLSAINTLHADLELREPAVGRRIRRFKRGLGHLAAPTRKAARTYLPPPVVERFHLAALKMTDAELRTARGRSLLQATVAVVFTFCFYARGGTGAALRAKDVRWSEGGLHVTLAKEKTRYSKAVSRVVTLGEVDGLRELLTLWERVRGPVAADASYYSLGGMDQPRSFPSTQVNLWLKVLLDHFGVAAPSGEVWTGHSLRKGAASGSSAIGVSIDRICYVGGWSIKSKAVFDYIDPTCPSTAAARRYFGWALPA